MIIREKYYLCNQNDMESLKEKTAKGLFWGGMNNGVQQLLGLAFGIILGRLLDPSDYGMTAMLAVFSVIANELQSSGFKTGLINLKSPTHDDYNAVFWFNILAGIAIYAVLFFSAPLIADYYHQPKLIPLSRYVFLGFVFSSFGMAQSAYLTKQMQIKQIAQCGMTATLTSSIVSVILAALGFGYWALATQYLLYIAVNTLLLWYFSPWRPTLHSSLHTPHSTLFTPHSTFHIPHSTLFTPLKKIFPFSVRIMLSAIFTQLNNNIMNLLLGRYYGETNTGHYNQAYQWSSKCFLLVGNMLKQVDQTVLVGLRDERERQLAVLRKMVRFTAFISFPLLFGLGLVSHEFIVLSEVGLLSLPAAPALPLWRLHAPLHPAHRLHHQPAPQRHLPVEHDHSGRPPDSLDGQSLARRHLRDGHRLHHIKYSMDVRLASVRPSPDALPPAPFPERHPALCPRSRSRYGGHESGDRVDGLQFTDYRRLPEALAPAAEQSCHRSHALLRRDAPVRSRHSERNSSFPTCKANFSRLGNCI